jgi:ligand-binding sensor domain-containing protein/DNA-binding CsgD family transcriptional regulator
MKVKYYYIVLYLTVLLFPFQTRAAWINVIHNYSRSDYRAGSQNWQIIQQKANWMYFANKSGVLEYNGNDWNLYTLHNQSDVRAIQRSDSVIYVGGLNEFGYLEAQETGELRYVCMSDSLSAEQRNFGNIWYIYENQNFLYFIADNIIIKYTNNTFSLIATPEKITFSNMIDNVLYIATDPGIYAFIGKQFYKIPYWEKFKNRKIRGIYPFNHKILIATASDGLYLLDNNGICKFETEVDAFIRKYELFSMAVNEKYLAIGTVLKGVVLIDHSGKALKYINESNGLQNNTVLNVFFDSDENVWLALDNGISYILLNSPISNLYSNRNFYGAGYAAVLYHNKLYLATNRGLYSSPYPLPISEDALRLQLINGSQGQIWNLNQIGDDLFVCSDKGLFIVNENALQSIDRKTGVWSVSQTMDDPNKIWVSTYDGFYVFKKINNRWEKINYVYGYPGSAVNYVEASSRVLWIRKGRTEILKIKVSESYDKVESYKYYTPSNGAPEDTYIFLINNQLLFCSSSGIYRFDENMQSFSLNAKENINEQNFNAIWERGDVRWYLGTAYIKKEMKDSTIYYAHDLPLIKDFQRLSFLDENEVIICNENGFALWNSNYNQWNLKHKTLFINKVSLSKTKDSLIYVNNFLGKKPVPEIAYSNNTIRFQYGLMSFASNTPVVYRCKLDNEIWSEETTATFKEYSNLPEGAHFFVVETREETGYSMSDEFHFIILSPWYRSKGVYFLYFLLFLFLLICLWKWDDKRIKKKKQQMELAKSREIMEKEAEYKKENEKKEQEINELKNEHLEQRIKHKSQELANIAISLANKNEILIEIKKDLQKISEELNQTDNGSNLRRNIIRLNSKIEENISQDDNLRKFEEHFDLVHNNFIRKISEKYPSLSLNERKMCAFIKMQLSSKEIAPLLNISVRGTETLRYRLRKKFGLSREDNLTSFLNQIHQHSDT